ncbi:MAG: DNA polymerase/3'-5' exonuclease PolX [Verrucomicrobiales bacterium]|jgi:DNA polymerase (family 10)|nr:DNA polymerase/3'-5' exonuclease PolX [Verrucomicrobiales bacterium]
MTNAEVAEVLQEIGTLLEIKGENSFKCRAYFNAARTLETCPEDVAVLVREERLGELRGIGEALQEKITRLVVSGSLPYYEELKASLPAGVLDLLKVPGLGPKKVGALYQELGIDSLEKLAKACRNNTISSLAGFSEKGAARILEGIAQLQTYANQHRYVDALAVAEDLVDTLRQHPLIARVALAGSLRRGKEIIKDIDIVASSRKPEQVMEDFVQLPEVQKIVSQGPAKSSVIIGGIGCDLRVVSDREFAGALHHFTGSKEHNVALRQRAIAQGYKLSEYGLDADGKVTCPRSEEELFKLLGLDYIPPELRENMGEIEAAANHELPRLVEWTQLKGCFHNHTVASDGQNTLEEMADAAASIGLEYLGIADHSKSSVQANGLSAERLLAQVEEIRKINANRDDISLLAGLECDILKDGSLDFEDDILSRLDYVVASVHSSFSLDEKTMTRRIIKAMENPHVTMIGHLTGRLLLRREAYQVNVGKIIDVAAKTGTWIELNANPARLDMDWRHWRAAKDKGVKCVINPDAHAVNQLGYLKPAVQIARKGWLEAKDVINCLSLKDILKILG